MEVKKIPWKHQGCQIFLGTTLQAGENITIGPKIDPSGPKIYQHLPMQDPPKFTQIGSFGLKICHLATLGNTLELK
jgi:hypothetical protein